MPNQPAQIPPTPPLLISLFPPIPHSLLTPPPLRMHLILQHDDKIEFNYFADILKGFESSPQSVIYQSHYLCNTMLYNLLFQTINFVMSNNLSLKYQRYTPSGSKDIRIKKFEFVAKIQFLYMVLEIFCAILNTSKSTQLCLCPAVFNLCIFFPLVFFFFTQFS